MFKESTTPRFIKSLAKAKDFFCASRLPPYICASFNANEETYF